MKVHVKGELFGLHWEDVDLKGQTVFVQRPLSEDGVLQVTEPKSERSTRLTPTIQSLLRRWLAW